MRQTQIFSGSSHPELVWGICERLGQRPGKADLKKFSNGETSVQIETSIREQDVFIVQSGSSKINDNIMELLIMISACKGGSAKSITAVMPYFPYSRQSKQKSLRGAITARMIANLLSVAGINHVITIDLHASQMQGFFKCPVDNLVAEPLIARWIKQNVPNWKQGVVVSKNPGGTKRATSLADALKLSFGIVTTDRRRFRQEQPGYFSMTESTIFDALQKDDSDDPYVENETETEESQTKRDSIHSDSRKSRKHHGRHWVNGSSDNPSSPLVKASNANDVSSNEPSPNRLHRISTAPTQLQTTEDSDTEGFIDERARHVITSRLVQGHVVDDDFPSPSLSAVTSSTARHRRGDDSDDDIPIPDYMNQSFISTTSSRRDTGMGGSADAEASSEEEEEDLKNPELETMVTLVGNVKDRPVFIIDDMIDKPASWIAAAETVVKRGGATKVYCMATHGLFGDECLREMEQCDCIDQIIVTNAFPIPAEKAVHAKKLFVIGVDNLLAEAIRRNHHGESISQLFLHYD